MPGVVTAGDEVCVEAREPEHRGGLRRILGTVGIDDDFPVTRQAGDSLAGDEFGKRDVLCIVNLRFPELVLRADVDEQEVLAFLDQPFRQLFDADAILLARRGLRDVDEGHRAGRRRWLSARGQQYRGRNEQDRVRSYFHEPLVRCIRMNRRHVQSCSRCMSSELYWVS